MSIKKKYDPLSKPNTPLHEIYPELSFVISGIYLDSLNIKLDLLFRYVVYFYERNCPELQEHTDLIKAREATLLKFKIPKSVYNTVQFEEIENEMALRYMLFGCDNKFNLFVSLSIQFSNMLFKIRKKDNDSTWSDNIQSLKSSSETLEISNKLDSLRSDIFGDMKHIEQYAMQKELNALYKAETGML